MNSSKTAIIVDSGCDLSQDYIDRYGIKILRLKILIGDEMLSDGLEVDPLEIYKKAAAEAPKTSTPNMQEVLDLVEEIKAEGYENIIGITISSGLSGTYNTMAMTFNEVEGVNTFAFDTKNISIGSGMFAIWAAKQLESGASFKEVCDGLERKINDSKVFFYMDTLDYLRKGGRISPAVAVVGKVLNLKPIISCNDKGTYYTVAKIRGANKGLSKLMEVVCEFANGTPCYLALMNGGAPEVAKAVKPQLTANVKRGEIIVEKQITATMAIHTGPGLIGIGVMLNP